MNQDDIDRIADAVADRVLERMAVRLSPRPTAPGYERVRPARRVPHAHTPPYHDDERGTHTGPSDRTAPPEPEPEPEGIGDLLGDLAEEAVEEAVEYTAEKVQGLIAGFVKAKGRAEAAGALRELGISTKAELAQAPQEKLAEAARRLDTGEAE